MSETEFVDVVGVLVLDGYLLQPEWSPGAVTTVDASRTPKARFSSRCGPALFATPTADAAAAIAVWPNGCGHLPAGTPPDRPAGHRRAESGGGDARPPTARH